MGLPDIDNIPDSGAVFTIGRSRFADNFASHFFIRQDPVVTIVCGDEHSAVVCESGRLFVFGSNDWGQLGLGHKNHVSKPSCVKILKPEKVTNVACGRAHTLICTGGQKIFACGSDQEGQLGRGGLAAGDSSSSPVLVYDCGLADGSKILEVAAGSHHSMALLSDGGVIAWGSNLEGQLGLPGITGLVNKPTKVPMPEPVKAISTGYYHTAFLTESGLIYVCGEAESGKLGIVVNFSTQAAPKQLQFPGPAAKIACGGHHSLVLTETGDLYCFGSNVSGQLGMGVNVTEVQTPKLLPRGVTQGEVITKIAAGESHTAIVTESGKLFMCGDGRHGKLGLEENENNVHEMTHAVKYDELTVTDVSCGGCHTILVGKRREDAEEEEHVAVQTDVGQRKNSLPPLKMPAMLGKLAGDVMSEKNELENAIKNVKNDINDTRDHIEEEIANAKNELETKVDGVVTNVTETVEENVNVVKKTAEDMMVGVKDAMNNIKKPEFPKKLADYIEEGNKTEELLNELAADDTESETKNNNKDAILAGAEGLMNRVKSSTASLKSNHSHRSDDGKRKPSADSLVPQNLESFGDESQIIPPPKPPRQRSGLSENAVHADKLTATAMDLERSAQASRNGSGDSKNPFENSDDEIVQKSVGRLGSDKNEKGHEIMEINKQGNEEKIKDTETAQDDADVQSPPPKTAGKISQLFKGKKSAGGEQNGVKEGGGSASNSKVKSRTCTVL